MLGPDGIAVRRFGFESRPAQVEMAETLLQRFLEGGVAAIEAPTGVGKTLAYLVAALLSGQRVVVSTHTKTLQDQLIDKELPRLEAIADELGLGLSRATPDFVPPPPGAHGVLAYALMKGRANYLCLDRFERKAGQQSFDFDGGDPWAALRQWSEHTERGDRAELTVLRDDDPRWGEVDARSETCTGMRCRHYEACFVVRMRQEAQRARLIVVNHHLLMSDIALKAQAEMAGPGRGGFEVIPEADVLLVDEAHGLESVAAEYFGGSVSRRMLERLGKDVTQFLAEGPDGSARLTLLLTQVLLRVDGVFEALPRREGRTRIGLEDSAFALARERSTSAVEGLGQLAEGLESLPTSDSTVVGLARRCRETADAIKFVLESEDADYVYWSERSGWAATLGASPIEVSNLLRQFLYPRFGAVGLCSATLSSGPEGLDYFLSAAGAPADTERKALASPFDYSRQAALFTPLSAPEPDDPKATSALVEHSLELLDFVEGGALLLFTSLRAMRSAHQAIRHRSRRSCLVQGSASKRDLLRRFVDEAPAILCATASFWEGVDVPGSALELVVIDRLPFDSPADPLVAARAERIRRTGRQPFPELHLPRAILRLKQGFGRLVRGPEDRGIVALMDGRVQSRSYGRAFLDALPATPRFREVSELKTWWTH
ncbi:MAG: ATP-dependent DNA helicase [Myxococcota bacterium]